jgi:AcrR family transcriptional regulator
MLLSCCLAGYYTHVLYARIVQTSDEVRTIPTAMSHRERLLEGAKRCLYEKGWARTTARDIVAASGTNLGSIGYHYGSKEALLTAAMMDGFREWGEDLTRILTADAEGDPLERLEAMWTKLTESFQTHRHLWMASFDAFVQAEHSPEVRKALADGYEHARPAIAGHFLRLPPDEVDEATARSLGSFLIAVQAGLAAQWLLDPEQSPSGRDVADALRRILESA